MKPLPDSELVAEVKKGNQRAFDALFLRWYPQVRRFILSITGDATLAEDLAQSVFMKLWNVRSSLTPDQSLRNYLFVLSRHAALDVLRSRRMLLCKQLDEVSSEVSAPEESSQMAEYNETYSRLQHVVSEMPPQRQAVFKMSRFESKSAKEIADSMGLSVRTVEKHIELALKDIRRSLN